MTPLQFLQSLGDTPEQVITAIESRGIKGRRHDCSQCIIAKLLTQEFQHENYCFNVFYETAARMGSSGTFPKEVINLPPPVAEVRRMFDAGELPQFNINLPYQPVETV